MKSFYQFDYIGRRMAAVIKAHDIAGHLIDNDQMGAIIVEPNGHVTYSVIAP